MDHYQIIDLALMFVKAIREADDKTLNAAYQNVANRANDSDFAHTHEPFSGLTVAIQAEFTRRTL
jgi:hypothetical protein